MDEKEVFVVLTTDAQRLLEPLLKNLRTQPIAKDSEALGIACRSVDFGGITVELHAHWREKTREGSNSVRLWLPHSSIRFAMEISGPKHLGFLAGPS